MTVPRLHHYIPQFYLRKWEYEAGKVVAYRCGESANTGPFLTVPKGVCAERDLYANRAMNVTESSAHDTELKFFQKVDDRAAIALDHLLSGNAFLNEEMTFDWIRFIISMFFRHPKEMVALRNRAKDEWKQIIAGIHPDLPDNLKTELSKFEDDFEGTESVDAED